jgi:hypothetical protein
MKIGLYGDSTQCGVSVYGGVPSVCAWTPAKILQMMLDNKYGQGCHTVRNYGIGGSTLQGALTTNMFPEGNVCQHVAAKGDDIVVANWGINDAFIAGLNGWTFASWVQSLKTNVEGQGKVFVYETPNPLNEAHASIVAEFVLRVKTIAGLKIMDNYGQITGYYPQWAAHLSDGIHPNYIMYFWIGDYLFKVIDPLL